MSTSVINVRKALKLLILRKMADKEDHLKALYEMYVKNLSLSDVMYIHDVSRFALRGLVQRLRDLLYHEIYIRELVKTSVPVILEKSPKIVHRKGVAFICPLCKRTFYNMFPEDHIMKHHKEIVEETLMRVIVEIKRRILEENMIIT
jgi:hypothetical protein